MNGLVIHLFSLPDASEMVRYISWNRISKKIKNQDTPSGSGNIIGTPAKSIFMATARCCPADCALRRDWEEELRAEREMLACDSVSAMHKLMKLLSHPLRLNIVLMLLKRDHCVCEFYYVSEEPQNLISYNLKKLKSGGLIESYYRSNHRIYRLCPEAEPELRNLLGGVVP
jgi:DNA-binding transcriptional ArsR family regulator